MEGLCKLLKCFAHVSSACRSRASCLLFQRRVQDVISPIVFEAAYSLGEHVTGEEEKELPALTPVLRWKKGQKIAQKNQVPENSWLEPQVAGARAKVMCTLLWWHGSPRLGTPRPGPPFPDLQNDEMYDLGVCV